VRAAGGALGDRRPRGGIGALIAKARYSLLRGRPAVTRAAENVVAPTTPRFAAHGPADLAFFSLSESRDSAKNKISAFSGPRGTATPAASWHA